MINKIMKEAKSLLKQQEQVIRYLVIGILTTAVSLVSYYGCVWIFLNPKIAWQLQLANVISWIVAVTFAYITNRNFVFKSKRKDKVNEAITFYSSRIVTLLVDMAIMFVGVTLLHFDDMIIKMAVQLIVVVLNYVLSKLFVFSEPASK